MISEASEKYLKTSHKFLTAIQKRRPGLGPMQAIWNVRTETLGNARILEELGSQ